MNNIMISYRREDTLETSARLYEALTGFFGRERVFQDVEKIPPGYDFVTYLRETIRQCSVVLVVIGRNWLQLRDEHGQRRIDAPYDWVRTEIELAHQYGIHIIPVLAQNATMPDEKDLPASIAFLARTNACSVRPDQGFRDDVVHLIDWILAVAPDMTPRFDWQNALRLARKKAAPANWKVYRRTMSYLRRIGAMIFIFSIFVGIMGSVGTQYGNNPFGSVAAVLFIASLIMMVIGSLLRSSTLLVLTPEGAVEQKHQNASATVLDYSQIENITSSLGLRMTGVERQMGGIMFMPGSGTSQTVVFIRERNGQSWEWIPDSRTIYGKRVVQDIIADFNRYIARNRGVGAPLAYDIASGPRSFGTPATVAAYTAPAATGYVGSYIPASRGVSRREASQPTGGTAIAMGLIALGILMAYDLFGWKILGPYLYRSLVFTLPQAVTLVSGAIATLRTRRLRASFFTGLIIGVGAAIYLIGRSLLFLHAIEYFYLQRAGIALPALVIAAFVGGLLALFINLFRR